MMDGNSSLDSNSPRGSSVNTAASPLSVFHAHVVRHTTGVIIEPTSNAHLEMLNQVPVASSITDFELTHGGSLDKVLEKRHRTVSRGRPRKEGLSRAWDAIIDDDGEGFDHTETSQFELKRSQSASNSTKVKKRRDFGAVHVVIDKGDCVYKGNLSAKNLDVKSRGLLNAEDRGAFQGVANFPSNKRLHRGKGDAKIMSDALDLIAQESKERGYL